jgi:hypothetical protein
MAATIEVHLPREGIREELTEALGERGLHAELFDDGEVCALHVSFVDAEEERLAVEVAHAIEAWLSARMLPLVVQRADGGCVVRPPAD